MIIQIWFVLDSTLWDLRSKEIVWGHFIAYDSSIACKDRRRHGKGKG